MWRIMMYITLQTVAYTHITHTTTAAAAAQCRTVAVIANTCAADRSASFCLQPLALLETSPGTPSGASALDVVGALPAAAAPRGVMSGLSWIDRLLPVWILAAMVVGVLLGPFAPQVQC